MAEEGDSVAHHHCGTSPAARQLGTRLIHRARAPYVPALGFPPPTSHCGGAVRAAAAMILPSNSLWLWLFLFQTYGKWI